MSTNVDPQIYQLAWDFLPKGTPTAFVLSLAQALQRTCDDHLDEYLEWHDEQRSIKGLTDEQKATI